MSRNEECFKVIILIARPGAGKSEVIDYLKQTTVSQRIKRFHIGNFEEIDDFPMLWTWFEEDHLLRKMGHSPLYTDDEGYFLKDYYWNLLIERISLEYQKKLRDAKYHDRNSVIVEFSRGKEHGGFSTAFQHLSDEILRQCAILYINVSWEQSLVKNRRRFNPERPDSILEHGLPDDKLEKLYKSSDWEELIAESPEYLVIKNYQVPYAIMENEDDVTTHRGDALGDRLEDALTRLWLLDQKNRR